MLAPNMRYAELKDSYLFNTIYKKTDEYLTAHPGKQVLRMGVGDVSLPLCDAVIKALHEAVDDQAKAATFHGYMPEAGAPFLRKAIAGYYAEKGAKVSENEIFISSGACDDLGDILELFDQNNTVMVIEPAYPEYVDTNILGGRKIVHLSSNEENGFLPEPDESIKADILYICSPNNPTGAVFNRLQLQAWIDFANKNGAVILFDAAYEIFIEDNDLPHSIYELDRADTCAIEICSLSKTAGFTGTRLGYTVVPQNLVRGGMNLNAMWSRNRETRTNGVSYILQKGAAAVFTPEGQAQIHKNIRLYLENASYFTNALNDAGIWYCGGQNSPYIWMKCPDGMSGWEFFDYLLNEIQVVGIPGDGFGECGKGYFRFSAFGNPDDTKEAANRLCALLKKG
ncbi:MAG: LL-diaminopimelate aminotransferase [Oscillospiraceae bacterium]|nr:LL-diaminopimelate aminotransferase [Oscillospiraceae bacterium]